MFRSNEMHSIQPKQSTQDIEAALGRIQYISSLISTKEFLNCYRYKAPG
jgi:hypothetical protein